MSGPTQITKTIEISDPDGFVMADPQTYLTHAEENSDPGMNLEMWGTTLKRKRAVETSDPDEHGKWDRQKILIL